MPSPKFENFLLFVVLAALGSGILGVRREGVVERGTTMGPGFRRIGSVRKCLTKPLTVLEPIIVFWHVVSLLFNSLGDFWPHNSACIGLPMYASHWAYRSIQVLALLYMLRLDSCQWIGEVAITVATKVFADPWWIKPLISLTLIKIDHGKKWYIFSQTSHKFNTI